MQYKQFVRARCYARAIVSPTNCSKCERISLSNQEMARHSGKEPAKSCQHNFVCQKFFFKSSRCCAGCYSQCHHPTYFPFPKKKSRKNPEMAPLQRTPPDRKSASLIQGGRRLAGLEWLLEEKTIRIRLIRIHPNFPFLYQYTPVTRRRQTSEKIYFFPF